nr:MAG TPA: hypothetical protein [Caudoviricetes sp.]
MPISRISLNSSVDGSTLNLDLNVIQQGWVTQIIEGTFGDKTNYSFTDGNLTSVESSNIDINVRMTPVVTITERTPESILNYLGKIVRNSSVTLTDTDIPSLSINYTKQANNTFTAELVEQPTSTWTQDCVVREIKYNYSEKPATIEFTITTTKPYLRGSTFDFYYYLNSTTITDIVVQFTKIFNRLMDLNVYGDIDGLALIIPPAYRGGSQNINAKDFPYKLYIKSEDSSKPREAWITKSNTGYKKFTFTNGANNVSSYGYITEAYPMFNVRTLKYILDTYGSYSSYKMDMPLGKASSWIRFTQLKRGL